MKQTIKKISLATLVICLLLVSCSKKSKDSTPTPTPETKTQLLTGKNWKITAMTFIPGIYNGAGGLITDYYAYAIANGDACSLDNILNFNIDGSYITTQGATLCDPAYPENSSGTWSFQNSETTLIQDGQESTIVTLNSTTLKLKDYYDSDGDGNDETEVNITYTKQ